MCVLPSKPEFREIEARERKFEKELEYKLSKLPLSQREETKQRELELSVLRFAGVIHTMGSH